MGRMVSMWEWVALATYEGNTCEALERRVLHQRRTRRMLADREALWKKISTKNKYIAITSASTKDRY